jgi:nucleotide-binding universal stress UspA family protein
MFTNIIVGVDGHEGGRAAVLLARQLAVPDAAISVAQVYGEQARNRGLWQLAARRGTDLIVLGAGRRGRITGRLLPDGLRATLSDAPCAVAIAPAGYEISGPIASVGAAFDGSAASAFSLDVARRLAAEHGAHLKALAVVPRDSAAEAEQRPSHLPVTGRQQVDEQRRLLSGLTDVESELAFGDPAEELARFSAGADILVVGTRGGAAVPKLIHDSAAEYLAYHARCPLLIVPRGAAAIGQPRDQLALAAQPG